MDKKQEIEREAFGPGLKLFTKLVDWVEKLNIRQSKVGNAPVFSNDTFPWAAELEREWPKIRAELEDVVARREELPNFQDISADVATITQDNNWKTFFLYGYGHRLDDNCARCPETDRLLQKIPGMKTAMFSILSPRKHIPAHRGPYNGVLRFHLGLIVPEPREQCRIRIDERIETWSEGKALLFDDAFDHEVWNDTDGVRVVLFVDFLRPLRWPACWINRFMIWLAHYTPYIKDAIKNHNTWAKKYYGSKAAKA